MKLRSNNTVEIGNIRFILEYRSSMWNRGAVIRVLIHHHGREHQALKFDPFERDAHYHLDPDGSNIVRPINATDPLSWSISAISESLIDLLLAAGYSQVSPTQQEVRSVIQQMETALGDLLPK
jgi:hypothetical protein